MARIVRDFQLLFVSTGDQLIRTHHLRRFREDFLNRQYCRLKVNRTRDNRLSDLMLILIACSLRMIEVLPCQFQIVRDDRQVFQ